MAAQLRRRYSSLALIGTYRTRCVMRSITSNPFYGITRLARPQWPAVDHVHGVIMTLAGAFVGGALTRWCGLASTASLALRRGTSALTSLLFAWLAGRGHDLTA